MPTKPKNKKSPHTLAQLADKYKCYQLSVQEPEHEAEFFDTIYKSYFGRKPKTLREDFCGTFAVCCEWVKLDKDKTAIGYDLDPEPLAWGKDHNLAPLKDAEQSRIELKLADVRETSEQKAEVLAAQNFSFWLFKTRDEVRDYFKTAKGNMAKDGIFVMDMMGGGDCYIEDHEDKRKIKGDYLLDNAPKPKGKGLKGFEYVWEQHSYNPINHDASFYIHFRFKDGSELHRAFEYHWRFWTLAEVQELLAEAGFSQVDVYWEDEDEDGDGNGEWSVRKEAPSDPSWIAYIIARV